MTIDEAKKAFDEMRAQGADDNAILGTLYRMFQDDKIDVEQLGALVNVLGYELTDEFKQMTPEDQKTKGWEADDESEKAEGVTDEEVEKAKEYGDDPDEKSDEKSDENRTNRTKRTTNPTKRMRKNPTRKRLKRRGKYSVWTKNFIF